MAGVTIPVVTIAIAPGAVTAGTAISIPSGAPKIGELVSAVLFSGSDATNPASATALTVVSGTPASGQIAKSSSTQVVLGDNTTTRDLLVITYIPETGAPGY